MILLTQQRFETMWDAHSFCYQRDTGNYYITRLINGIIRIEFQPLKGTQKGYYLYHNTENIRPFDIKNVCEKSALDEIEQNKQFKITTLAIKGL